MKPRLFTRKSLFLLAIALIFSSVQLSQAITIVNFPLVPSTTNGPATGGYSAGNSACRLTGTTSTGVAAVLSYDANKGASTTNWNSVGGYWSTNAINASSFYNLSLTVQMNSQSANPNYGPRDFKLQYSINGGGWVDNPQQIIALTSTLANVGYNIPLPAACNYQSNVRVRFVTTSTFNVKTPTAGNTITAAASSYMKGLVISGEQLLAPSTQASNISVVAMTPTSITVDCSPGLGTNRIILINSTNTFTDPADDYTPASISTSYSGSGQQCIYDGIGSSVTVNVPSSKNLFYFRIYDYNLASGKKRYQTMTDVDNPKICQLENVILPTFSNVGLINAILGGTITSPASGTITERGIYWSTSPGVNVFSNKVPTTGTGVLAFTFLVTNLQRGSDKIYFKAYCDNLTGTALSEEASFTNIPIFTGSGNWETAARWNVKEVPGANGNVDYGSVDDSPIIRGICTLTTTNNVTDLNIESGSLSISPKKTLKLEGVLTNSVGNSGLVIKSSSVGNGSLIFTDTQNNANVPASVEMYSIAKIDNTYHWQYFGIPVQSTTVGSAFTNVGIGATKQRVRKYDESNKAVTTGTDVGLWKPSGTGNSMTAGESMVPIDGYEVVQPASNTPFTFKGNLYVTDFSRQLAFTPTADWKGCNILANPFTAAMDITKMTFGAGTEATIYLYNTGSRSEWETHTATAGTYTASTVGTAGKAGVPGQIPSMQGFLVNTLVNSNTNATIDFAYADLQSNNELQRVRGTTKDESVVTRIDVDGTTSSDIMWIFSEPSCSHNFDNGWDGRKMLSSGTTQLYAIEEDGQYQIEAVNDITNVTLGFTAVANGDYKLSFTHINTESIYGQIYLVDLKENIITDITANGSEYSFYASTTDADKRFKIVTGTTESVNVSYKIKIFNSGNIIFVQNDSPTKGNFTLYNASGKIIKNISIGANSKTSISISTTSGVCIGKMVTESDEITKLLIIR